jgi:hypothetical protein
MGTGWKDDEDDDWPPPETDPVKLEKRRREISKVAEGARRGVTIVYASLGIMIIIVILIITLR